MNAFGLLTTRPVRHLHHTGEHRPSQRPPATCSKKVNRVTFTELFDDDTMMLKRFQFELLRVLRANPRGNGRKARAARDT